MFNISHIFRTIISSLMRVLGLAVLLFSMFTYVNVDSLVVVPSLSIASGRRRARDRRAGRKARKQARAERRASRRERESGRKKYQPGAEPKKKEKKDRDRVGGGGGWRSRGEEAFAGARVLRAEQERAERYDRGDIGKKTKRELRKEKRDRDATRWDRQEAEAREADKEIRAKRKERKERKVAHRARMAAFRSGDISELDLRRQEAMSAGTLEQFEASLVKKAVKAEATQVRHARQEEEALVADTLAVESGVSSSLITQQAQQIAKVTGESHAEIINRLSGPIGGRSWWGQEARMRTTSIKPTSTSRRSGGGGARRRSTSRSSGS